MLVTIPLGPLAAAYYFHGQPAGRWTGRGTAALGLSGPVDRHALASLLQGRHPFDGHFLPAHKPPRRRAGWDLVLAAPKSVSLLAALAGDDGREIAGAHTAAVDDMAGHFERRYLAGSAGLVAAAFDHGVNASVDPHLHTHLIVCNLSRDREGVWNALRSGWWTERPAMSAIYQMSLRHHLVQRGLSLEWRVRDDGFAEVIGVPRTAVRAASGRGRAAAANRSAFGDNAGRIVGIRSGAMARTRWPPTGRGGPSGFGREQAARVVLEARQRAMPGLGPGLADAVSVRLAARRSNFRVADVLVALAACTPGGLEATTAEHWVTDFCAAAKPVPTHLGQAPRWTSDVAQALDQRLWARASRAAARPTARLPDGPELAPQALVAAGHLVAGSQVMPILLAPAGRTNLLAHAAVLEAAGRVWKAAGQRVVVVTGSDRATQRWQVLTGLDRCRPGQAADVMVVDHADRRPTAELLSLLRDAERVGARTVLVEGGTRARLTWRCSAALTAIGDRLGRVDPGPPPVWDAVGPDRSPWPTTADAVGHLLACWVDAGTGPDRAVLVGLGYAEADGLNQAARATLAARGLINGPALPIGGRLFQQGDQALALRRLAPGLAPGTLVSVLEVDPRRNAAKVTWDGGRAVLDRVALAHLGYGYAVTPPLAARTSRPLMVLGPADSMGPHRGRVVAAAHLRPDTGRARDRSTGLGLA